MLPALSHQVAVQLAPVALAAARSWAGSSWLTRRSFAAAAEGCTEGCIFTIHALMPH